MADLELLLEAERRGLLPDDKQQLLSEARRRGLVPTSEAMPERSVGGFVSNVFESAGKVGADIAHAVTNPTETAKGLYELGKGTSAKMALKAAELTGAEIKNPEAKREAEVAAKAPEAVSQHFADRWGSVDKALDTLYKDPVGAAMDLSMFLGGGGAALRGGATAARTVGAADTASTLAKAGEMASAAGQTIDPINAVIAAGRPVVDVGLKGYGVARNMLSPSNAAVVNAMEGRWEPVLNALRQPAEIVAGSKPTMAQATADVAPTRLAALEADVGKKASTDYFERAAEQNKAHKTALSTVAGTDAELEAAKEIKKAQGRKDYGSAGADIVEGDAKLENLLQRPAMQDAIRRAKKIAANRDEEFSLKIGTPATTAESKLVGATGEPITREVAAVPTTASVNDLHTLKIALDGMAKEAANPTAITKFDKASIGKVRSELTDWLEANSDKYLQARQNLIANSQPINQMTVGQYLESKLVPAKSGTGASLRLEPYARALEEAPQTIKRATGEARFTKLEDAITDPKALQTLYDIRDDLIRMEKAENKAKAGARGGSSIPEIHGGIVPAFLSKITTAANFIFHKAQGHLTEKAAIEMAKDFLDPSKSYDRILAAQKFEQGVQASKANIRNRIAGAARAVQPTVAPINALSNIVNQNALAGQ